MANEESRKRRRYGAELKAQILAECAAPGASVARVAMAHGINANIVHGWRKLARRSAAAPLMAPPAFIQVAVASAEPTKVADSGIEVELRRGAVTVKLRWPLGAVAELAAWTRELLR